MMACVCKEGESITRRQLECKVYLMLSKTMSVFFLMTYFTICPHYSYCYYVQKEKMAISNGGIEIFFILQNGLDSFYDI